MSKTSIPETLFNAIVAGDMDTIRKFGKQGFEAFRRKREVYLKRLEAEIRERDHQANLDICPID